jgi:uncharacterized membrane protein
MEFETSTASRATAIANRISLWFARHWMAVINAFLAVYIGLPFLAPVLMFFGMERPAQIIYQGYLFLCHELPQRSYFLFGMQPVYTLEQLTILAGVDQLPGYPLYGAYRSFVGNPVVGYKVALCQRDVAIYGTMLVFGLLFSLMRNRIRPLPLWAYLVFGLIPIGLDGGSQLIGYLLPWIWAESVPRESTWWLRSITGALFGLCTMWLALPSLHESFVSMEEQLAEQREM